MTTIDLIINKYNNQSKYKVTFEEMILDFESFEPTNIPIIDICIISTIGKYIHEFTNQQKWIVCPNLKEEIVNMIINLSDKLNNIHTDDLKLIFDKYQNNKNSPDCYSLENELFKFVDEIIKNKLPMLQINDKNSIKEYLDFRMNFNNEYKLIINKYKIDFNEIEIKMNNIYNIIINKFEKLEESPEFEDCIQMIDNINVKVSIKMEKLVEITNEQIEQAKKQSQNLVGYNGVMLFEQLKKEIMNIFNKEMNLYYENEIKLLKFNDYINDILLQLFEIEKNIYRLRVTFTEIENGIKNY